MKRVLSLAALALAALFTIVTSQAAAPLLETQVPGFYRAKVGAFEVTAQRP